VSENIEKESKAWTATIIVILGLAMIILFFIMFLLVRGIGRSLQAEIPEGSEGDVLSSFDDDDDDDK
jgi:Na+-transporting methylmalonyl-CoA/oxaloacetate decarboxylase gamma subunit